MSDPTSSDTALARPERAFTRWPGLLSLTLCVLLGPLAALANQQAIYAGNSWACGHEAHATLHLIPALSLLLVIGTGVRSYLDWRAVGGGAQDEFGDVAARTRFLTLLGMAISVFSALVILAQWFGIFMFWACARA